MKKIVLVSALITLLIIVLSFGGMAIETVDVNNYSFTFNMTAPHEIRNLMTQFPASGEIKTFDGYVVLNDRSWNGKNEFYDPIAPDFYYIGSLKKNIAGEGDEGGRIYALTDHNELTFFLEFETIDIQSTLNITQSVDFFRDLKITRIKR